jgi:hypothetical protein
LANKFISAKYLQMKNTENLHSQSKEFERKRELVKSFFERFETNYQNLIEWIKTGPKLEDKPEFWESKYSSDPVAIVILLLYKECLNRKIMEKSETNELITVTNPSAKLYELVELIANHQDFEQPILASPLYYSKFVLANSFFSKHSNISLKIKKENKQQISVRLVIKKS